MTLKELLDEEIAIKGFPDIYLEEVQGNLIDLYPMIERATIRFSNQQTQELQAKILHYRNSLSFEDQQMYDEYFGITNDRSY